eukprot:TRINITY_DN6172_c0_g1_i2.p1 TRINITY_DN6172_c0_g1~~TRINITY_DN6172_c0_g1_i2.p1  ORF type:complete len:246 (-),score=28.00 TRINITY_DN6172_c0_g1_i2:109-846(-)
MLVKEKIWQLLQYLYAPLQRLFDFVKSMILKLVNKIWSGERVLYHKFKAALTAIKNVIVPIFVSIFNILKAAIQSVWNVVKQALIALRTTLTQVWGVLKASAIVVFGYISGVCRMIGAQIRVIWGITVSSLQAIKQLFVQYLLAPVIATAKILGGQIKATGLAIKATGLAIKATGLAIKAALIAVGLQIKTSTIYTKQVIVATIRSQVVQWKAATVGAKQELIATGRYILRVFVETRRKIANIFG